MKFIYLSQNAIAYWIHLEICARARSSDSILTIMQGCLSVHIHESLVNQTNNDIFEKKLDYCFTVCFGWSYATKFDFFFFILYRFDDIVFDVGALTVSAAAAVSATCY